MKKEDICLDLSKLTHEQIEKVFSILPPPEYINDYDIGVIDTILKTTNKGRWYVGSATSDLKEVTFEQFLDIVQPKTYPRVMEVSDDKDFPDGRTLKRVVFMEKNNSFLTWRLDETLKESEDINSVGAWKYAREIGQPLELTLTEIAKKYGVSEVKIKQ